MFLREREITILEREEMGQKNYKINALFLLLLLISSSLFFSPGGHRRRWASEVVVVAVPGQIIPAGHAYVHEYVCGPLRKHQF
jgi:hypothetical protein